MQTTQADLERRIASTETHLASSLRHATLNMHHLTQNLRRLETMRAELQALTAKRFFVAIIENCGERARVVHVMRKGIRINHGPFTLGVPKSSSTLAIHLRGVRMNISPYASLRFTVEFKNDATRYEVRPCLTEQDAREYIE